MSSSAQYKPHKYEGTTFSVTTFVADKAKQAESIAFRCKDQEEMQSWLNALLRQKLQIEETVETIVLD